MSPRAGNRTAALPRDTTIAADRPAAVVGIVGLGHMGEAFARNLLKAGFRVIACDRRPERTAILAKAGCENASGLRGLSACDVVVTSLPDDAALETVTLGSEGLAALLPSDALHISMSTISTGLSRRLAGHRRGWSGQPSNLLAKATTGG